MHTHDQLNSLALRAQKGDVQAFNQIVEATQGWTHNRALGILKDHHDAQDATQEAYLKIYQNLARWDATYGSFGAYLARYVTLEAYRIQRDRQTFSNTCIEPAPLAQLFKLEYAPDMQKTPEEHLLYKEELDQLEAVLIGMHRNLRLVWILRNIEEYSFIEIAKITRIPYDTCRVYGSRAWQRIQEKLNENR